MVQKEAPGEVRSNSFFFFFSLLSSISRRLEQGERDGPVLFRVLMLQRGGAGSDFPVIALASFYFPVRSALQ